MSDSIIKNEKIYDDYVKYYNDSGGTIGAHISVFAEFSRIEETVVNRVTDLNEGLNSSLQSIITLIEGLFDKDNYDKNEPIFTDLKLEMKDRFLDDLKYYRDSDFHFLDSNRISYLKEEKNKLFEGLEEKVQNLGIEFLILTSELIIPKLNQSLYHRAALRDLNGKIIDNHYPSELQFYNELPEDEKLELRSNGNPVGAPLRNDVPQEKIEEIVLECLSDKSNKRFIHQEGKYKGRANQSQILEYIKEYHPDIVKEMGRNPEEGLVDRHLIRRIKKAFPKHMT